MGENIACCIDLLYISAALCSRTQSSGQAPDSRREPSVSKFSSQMAKYCSSSHNRWSIYVTDQLASLPPRSPLMERLHLLSPVPLWLNRSTLPAGLFWRTGSQFAAVIIISIFVLRYMLLWWYPQLVPSAEDTLLKMTRPSFIFLLRYVAARLMWSCEQVVMICPMTR